MATRIRLRRCVHCGEILQTEHPKEKGYIDKEIVDQYNEDSLLYCNHCYNQIKAISSTKLESDVNENIMKILKDAVATDAYIIWVVDLFTFCGNINSKVAKQLKHQKVTVIGTKRDLFPSSINDDTFIRYLKETFEKFGIKPHSIKVYGNTDELDGDAIIQSVNLTRQGHDVYMIGSLTSGKTSLINRALKNYKNKSNRSITIDNYPETNVQVLQIPLSNSSYFYELPGFELNTSVTTKIEKEVNKYLIPRKKIKTTIKTLSNDETLAIGNLATFSFKGNKSTQVKFYAAEDVETKKIKEKNIREYLVKNNHVRNVRPVSEQVVHFTDYDIFEYSMENDDMIHDIAIQGLGWLSFKAKGQKVIVSAPKGVAITESLGKIR